MGAPFTVGISITSSGVAAAPAAPISRFATLADVAKHAASTHVAALGDLSDVDTAGVVDADVLTFNVLTGLWEPAPAGAGAIALDDLTDVDVAGALDGKILRKVAGVWQDDDETPVSLGLDDLTDVDVAGALDGTILKKVAGVWQDAAEPGVPALDDLTDVDVAGAADGRILKKVAGIWQDADESGGGASPWTQDVNDPLTSLAGLTTYAGTWAITGGQLECTVATSTFCRARSNITVTALGLPAVVEVEFEVPTWMPGGGANRRARVGIGPPNVAGPVLLEIRGDNTVVFESDATFLITSTPYTVPAAGTWVKIRLIATGHRYTGFIDGVKVLESQYSNNLNSTAWYPHVGTYSTAAGVIRWRNLKCWTMAGGLPA